MLDISRKPGQYEKEVNEGKVKLFLGDAGSKDIVAKACENVDGIIHAASLVDTGRFGPDDVSSILIFR